MSSGSPASADTWRESRSSPVHHAARLPPPRVVATGPWDAPGWEAPLVDAGCDVVCGPSIDRDPVAALSEASLIELCRASDAILASTRDYITGAVLDAAPNLRLVAKATIGVEKIDVAAATARGVLVANSPAPENIIGLAEATVGLMVALAKGLLEKEDRLRRGRWRDHSTDGVVLAGRSIGIVGLGRVGSAVARRLAGWDATLVGYDPYVSDADFDTAGVTRMGLSQLLSTVDLMTLHVPLTDETRGMIGPAEFARLRRGAFLVNTSRGPVIDESAFIAALSKGHLAGAALDVFDEEPLPMTSPLRSIDRRSLVLTPHSIGSSWVSRGTGTGMAVHAILSALSGVVPSNVLNPEVTPEWRSRWTGASGR